MQTLQQSETVKQLTSVKWPWGSLKGQIVVNICDVEAYHIGTFKSFPGYLSLSRCGTVENYSYWSITLKCIEWTQSYKHVWRYTFNDFHFLSCGYYFATRRKNFPQCTVDVKCRPTRWKWVRQLMQVIPRYVITNYHNNIITTNYRSSRIRQLLIPILLVALSPSKHWKHHPSHAHSPVVFRKVQFSGPYFYPLL